MFFFNLKKNEIILKKKTRLKNIKKIFIVYKINSIKKLIHYIIII